MARTSHLHVHAPCRRPPRRLTSLDTLLLADETKALAEATFLKKQMYYNMRAKTLRRNARNIVRLALEGKQVRARLCDPYTTPHLQRLPCAASTTHPSVATTAPMDE